MISLRMSGNIQNVEVSDTTGDAKRDIAGNKNINEKIITGGKQ